MGAVAGILVSLEGVSEASSKELQNSLNTKFQQ